MRVNVTVDLPTLLGLQDNLGELHGYGPIPAALARMLAASGEDPRWRRLVFDPVDGHLLDAGRAYPAPPVMVEFVKTRDVDDRFPGATRTAANAQVDHIRAHAGGGPTSSANSQSLSPHTHRAKTFGGFTPRHLGHGIIQWTTPLGRTYTTRPHDYRPNNGDDREGDNRATATPTHPRRDRKPEQHAGSAAGQGIQRARFMSTRLRSGVSGTPSSTSRPSCSSA